MTNDSRHKRRQLFVDANVQGVVLRRVVGYWLTCMVTIFVGLLCYRIVNGPARPFYTHLDDMWFHYGPVFIASLVMLPLVVIDCLKLTNRFAGPMFRLRRDMGRLAQGKATHPVHFRNNDFWREFAENFNTVRARIEKSEARDAESTLDESVPKASENSPMKK